MTEYDAAKDTHDSIQYAWNCLRERPPQRPGVVVALIVLAILCGAMGCAERNDPTRTQIAGRAE